eukprot:TRINITY_DN5303_c0_g1_i1.p1 TRINITY_DN5303_c0_g1~~TRINITY_DN5303_c0_g1_i1.p1  ORF type:complete len:782 (-),score=153.35 TRINITY_DN5303_c0_g1_i1:109-2454(-)
MEQHYGDFDIFPKELKFLIFRRLDSRALGRLLQLNKTYSRIVDDLGIWKYLCLSEWELSPERAKQLTQDLSNKINWKREYRILEEYSNRIFNNQLIIRPGDSEIVKHMDEDPNSLHYHAFTDANIDAKAASAQGKFKLFPLPHVNFCVAYYEVRVENFGPDESIVGIGLALDKYLQAMPGWGKDSYGLHSDDGCYFDQRPFGIQFCDPWHQGDTFGLGVNYATKEIFITKNGVLLGTAGSKVRNLMHMYPTVGIKRFDNKCRVNFGQRPFEFDIVHYIQELDKDDKVKAKWPFKLYSQIIQEFETQLLDSDNPEEVDSELMAANDYYEKTEPVVEEIEGNEDQQRERLLEWLFSKFEVLQSENTVRDVAANRPEMKTMLNNLIANLDFPVDPNQPLPQLLNIVKDQVFVLLSSNYVDYVANKRNIRRAEERKNPELKKRRTITELDNIYHENATLMLVNQEFPDDHPMIVCLIRILLQQMPGTPMPHVITMQERADVCLVTAYRLFASDRTAKAEKDLIKRRKRYQEQHKSERTFNELYGPTPFAEVKIEEPTPELQDVKESETSAASLVAYTEDDKIAAQRYAMATLFGTSINPENPLPAVGMEIGTLLLWWYLAYEEPYDPRTSLESYREACYPVGQEEVDFWEAEVSRWSSVVRGTYGVLADEKSDQTVTAVITGAWNEFVEINKNLPNMKDKTPAEIILESLPLIITDLPKAFDMIMKVKEDARRAKQEKQEGRKAGTSKLQQRTSWQTILVTAASVAVSVGLIAGTVLFFQKKWRK